MLKVIFFLIGLLLVVIVGIVCFTVFIKILTFIVTRHLPWFVFVFCAIVFIIYFLREPFLWLFWKEVF